MSYEIQKKAIEIWKLKYFKFVYHYYLCKKYSWFQLPPPFSLIDNCLMILIGFIRCFFSCGVSSKRKEKKNELTEESVPLQFISSNKMSNSAFHPN